MRGESERTSPRLELKISHPEVNEYLSDQERRSHHRYVKREGGMSN